METILTSLKAGVPRDSFTELSLPYFKTFNKLVTFDSELNAGTSSDLTRSSRHGIVGDKLLTHLSPNPSQFERDLRTIVLDLYSDHGPDYKGHRDLISMDSNNGTLLKTPFEPLSKDVFKHQENVNYSVPSLGASSLQDMVRTPPILLKYEETALIDKLQNEGPLNSPSTDAYVFNTVHSSLTKHQKHVDPLHVDPKTYKRDSERQDETASFLKSMNELQKNLQNFELTDAPGTFLYYTIPLLF
jgi:hypothetical protein